MVITIVSPMSATAASAGSVASVSSAPTDRVDGDVDGTAMIPGTNTLCRYHYKWHVDTSVFGGGVSKVEWTNNPCGFSIQERSWCEHSDLIGGSWSTSGVVVRTDLWDASSCDAALTFINRGEVRFDFGGGWNTYKTFWTP
jgi:hypothetical protein